MCGAPLSTETPEQTPKSSFDNTQPPIGGQIMKAPPTPVLLEAKNCFEQALGAFHRAYDQMRGAKSLSTWDTFFGGGFIADIFKHKKVDDSRELVQQAIQWLTRAYQLVPNAPRIRAAQIHNNDFMWDVVFDNIISDWSVREKIKKSLASLEATIYDTQAALLWINSKL